jgi:hypothetical protein
MKQNVWVDADLYIRFQECVKKNGSTVTEVLRQLCLQFLDIRENVRSGEKK